MSEQRRLVLALVLIALIFGAFQIFIEGPRIKARQAALEAAQQTEQQTAAPQAAPNPDASALPNAPALPGAASGAVPPSPGLAQPQTREAALGASPRLAIKSPRLEGSIALKGGRIDDLRLLDYRVSVDKSSAAVTLFNPAGGPDAYFADFGWVAEGGASVKLPDADSLWTPDKTELSPGNPVTLSWSNGEGLIFTRRIALDENYMFTVEQAVRNETGAPVTLFPYGLVARLGLPRTSGIYILQEGPLGVFRDGPEDGGQLVEMSYTDIVGQAAQSRTSRGGWIGLTDHYWLTALVPAQDMPITGRFTHVPRPDLDRFQTDIMGVGQTVSPGAEASYGLRLFAGAKEVALIDRYQDTFGIIRFDRAIDWGWFYFLTRPMFFLLDWFHKLVGNVGIAILLLTVLVKTLFFPLAYKSYVSMSAMKKLQPELLKLRERHGDDRQKLSQAMMELYKREKVNPASGCLPILLQIPVFFALYKVLYVTIEMRHAPFFGWIQDLSAPDPTSWINLFGLLPFHVPNLGPLMILSIGLWPILMGISMWLQFKMNPQPPDPVQAKIFSFMPIVFTFMLGSFASGLVIYWTWNNLLSITQQWIIMKREGVKDTLA